MRAWAARTGKTGDTTLRRTADRLAFGGLVSDLPQPPARIGDPQREVGNHLADQIPSFLTGLAAAQRNGHVDRQGDPVDGFTAVAQQPSQTSSDHCEEHIIHRAVMGVTSRPAPGCSTNAGSGLGQPQFSL